MPSEVTLLAPAKVNLYLVVGPRGADGYHELTTVFQALDDGLADVVTVRPARGLSVRMRPSGGVPDEENLALKAAQALAREVGASQALAIEIDKRIPAGGGLGGASSDAAAVLVGACTVWGLDPEDERVLRCARALGADVPFFLCGGTALYRGRGDVLVRRLPSPQLDVIVVTAGEPVSTAEAYALHDTLPAVSAPDVDTLLQAIEARDARRIGQLLHNDLAPAARALARGVAEVERWLAQRPGVHGVAVTGSGSCVFGVCASRECAEQAARDARSRGWWAQACSASPHGVRIIDGR